ncbi:glutamyl-tRNA reductase [Listeria newyorkensis]|uniref:Glutamyl-tRNA reductase n=1 Tax=Listeria newyorkensis TaxID=1497681 RepID=A0ABX4XLF2_9LIST|nr:MULTISPECIES: glutamyl-tRNA reductase [Listeria]KGL38549.1 glutamyl-tRNA reductase [Listeriaceae bacterium FSL A5-0209]KGL45982.1 glutamyl-tRNA reductase [Listeria newyorkensis]KMT59276.1 glutamyl-tRNA reductase [Listeria newyorkensis]PNP90533.1 glutamyl-tRNA reductase [Listeria newyorkensis]RQW67954.1 glutamyl-tRNA reductase [Listeria sp. SHR_NRA_18]
MYILSVGLNHTSAPIEIRERLAFNPEEEEMALVSLHQEKSILENVIISTCNRTEIFAVVDQLHTGRYYIKRFLANWFQMDMQILEPYLLFFEEEEAVKHLYRVTSGLDSLIIGETQILGQVKDAFTSAQTIGTTGTILNQLFRESVHFAKNVHHTMKINENAVSISYAAVEVVKKACMDVANKKTVIVGAGKMGVLAIQNMLGAKIADVTLLNRTSARAEDVAEKLGIQWSDYASLSEQLKHADIVITSTSATTPIITQNMIAEREKALVIIDIALPRNVEATCAEIPNVTLFDIDDLGDVIQENTQQRQAMVIEIEAQIEEACVNFYEWEKQLGVVPIIKDLREKALALQAETMQSLSNKLPNLSDREQVIVGKHMKSIINQLLKHPISELKEMATSADAAHDIEVFQNIFDLQKTEETIEITKEKVGEKA